MGTEVPKTQDSSGNSDSNSDSENSSSSETSASEWECSGGKQSNTRKPHFSVTSSDSGLKLKIAAIPQTKQSAKKSIKPSVKKKPESKSTKEKAGKKKRLSESSSSSASCSKCSSDSSSDDDLPLKTVKKTLPSKSRNGRNIIKSDSDDEKCDVKESSKNGKDKASMKANLTVKKGKEEVNQELTGGKGQGRQRRFASPAAESGAFGSSTSSSTSSTSSSSSSSSSSSDSDSADVAAGSAHVSDDASALVAACPLQVIDDADLAELFPEQTPSAPAQQPSFAAFSVHTTPENDDKSVADTGDGSSSEMELTPQLVTAAIQRATADSSGSENECSNADIVHQNTSHYASSLLQQFVAQTQLLSSTAPINSINTPTSLSCVNTNSIEGVGISDCVLGQINNIPEIQPITTNFLNSSHLSPQQTEELSQIKKTLEEITSVAESVEMSIPNPESLDCDNNDFMSLDIASGGSEIGSASDLMKSSPITVVNSDMAAMNRIEKLDAISTNSVESQEDIKDVVIESRRKRGRPRKVKKVEEYESKDIESQKEDKSVVNVIDFHNNNDPPNVSPDSGILSNHNSPTHSPMRRHDIEESHSRHNKKSLQKENNTMERKSMRSKSRSRAHHRSDSSECDYQKKKIENEIKQIKTEAPSPIPLKQEPTKFEKSKKNDHKLDIAALDRMLYATDRVLYPPRKKIGRKLQSKSRASKTATKTLKDKNQYYSADSDEDSLPSNRSVLSGVYAKRKELNSKLSNLPKSNKSKPVSNAWRDHQSENEAVADDPLDPTWKQIDLNPKYKDILSGYKSDYEFKPYKSCSKLIESGYKSDYGCRSGYKSDCYRSGYKTDHRSGYKSDKSGYKTDYSVRSMRRRTRKFKKTRSVRNRSYYKNQKHFVSDQEILLLTNKTFSSLTLGHSSSDSECETFLRKPNASPKYVSVCTKYPFPSRYNYGFTKSSQKQVLRLNSSDPFAPGPVFSGLQRPITTYNIFKLSHNNNNILLKPPSKASHGSSSLPSLKPAFTHKFGASPICANTKLPGSKKENDILRQFPRISSPKPRKQTKSGSTASSKKENILKALPSIFERAKNSYIPNNSLSRNVFLNFKKPNIKPTYHIKKQRRTVVLAPPKINLKPTERPSRITIKTESKHHRHRSKRRHRSRSVSRSRDSYTSRNSVDSIDQKFTQDMDTLISNFIKFCHVAPKIITATVSQKVSEKEKPTIEPPPPKLNKRTSKKRKTSDNQEIMTPTSKRRHKKQLTESQNKGGKDTNEHKLPLKKRHYHINSSTNNSLSLSLVSSEFDENSKNEGSPEKFLCTETDCMGEMQTNDQGCKSKSIHEKSKKGSENVKSINDAKDQQIQGSPRSSKLGTGTDAVLFKDEKSTSSPINPVPTVSNIPDEMSIRKPSSEQSELSKKIYETSEKLKAVHKMVHDLEKSLPKSKENDSKTDSSKVEIHRTSSPRSERKVSPVRNSAPIVTPKKRHRLEADKVIANSSLDQVVQSLSKKLTDDKPQSNNDAKDISAQDEAVESDKTAAMSPNNLLLNNNHTGPDPLKSMSARSLYKSSILPAQKSEIMTRKKNRLEGLTSNLVSKINPSAATKVLDTLLNNNIRKSIESRILEKEKGGADTSGKSEDKGKESPQINTRASVIKSPVSKGKLLDSKRQKADDCNSELINLDKPTGIFEPSIDLEDQIPKSSICVSNILMDSGKNKNKNIDTEAEIPLALISEISEPILRPKRGESIAAVISDKIQETAGGHNLRQTKRNLNSDNDDINDKKKKKTGNCIIRESKLVLPSKILVPKIQTEKLTITDLTKKSTPVKGVDKNESNENKTAESNKKKPRRRKAINRTGFPSIKKKKKKVEPNHTQSNTSDNHLTSEDTDHSAFERVPKDGEAMSSFIERTNSKKPELKVVLNKDDLPKQGRLTVVSLEKLQGKDILKDNNNKTTRTEPIVTDKKSSSILRAPALQLKQTKSDKDQKNHINKWEVLSETDSIPSLTSSLGNDPEDSIPLSLLNVKATKPGLRLDNTERLKRKTRALSPSNEIEEILSKRKNLETNNKVALRPKSSLAILYPNERRLTRSSDDVKTKGRKSENKKLGTSSVEEKDKPSSITTRRKSRSCQAHKKAQEVQSSSRESSIDTVISQRLASKSREPSLDTLQDNDENEPLPLHEKEIDFEKSIDVLSKTIICKKRVASSRDESPASSVDNREKPVVSKKNPRLRKKFLAAGLFSDYYKEDSRPEKGKKVETQTEFTPPLLSPPPYCERWVRRRAQPFALPHDIWWQHHCNQPVPSWNYKKIRTNVYYDVKPSAEECESVACNCAPASGCNEDCINRLVYCECSPQLCPCGDRCKNQRIQRHEWASGLERFMTENKGWGVRTKHKITSGDFILEYVGEVVSDKEFKERMATRYARDTHHYCLHLDGGLVIDGHRMGGDGRFVNHSCRPNCEMQKWTANGTFRMALFALRDIDPSEELTYDYNFSLFNPAVGQPCKCDSEDCRGVIGGKSQRITKLPVKTQSRTPSNASNQSGGSNGHSRVGRPRKAVKCNKKVEPQVVSCDLKNMTILKFQQHLNKLWQEPQMKPLTPKERAVVKERHCFLFRNLENVRRIRERLTIPLSPSEGVRAPSPIPAPTPSPAPSPAPCPGPTSSPGPATPVLVDPLELPGTMDSSVFLRRLRSLRAEREDGRLQRLEDDPAMDRPQRLARVFRAIYDLVVAVKDEDELPVCAPLLKLKPDRAKSEAVLNISTISANIDKCSYETVAQFDSDMNGVFSGIIREHSKTSTLGMAATQLKKVYNTNKSDFSDHLTKILGSQESLPAGFTQKSKSEEVIMCICGLHVEEGLMVQCGGARCGVWQHARCMRARAAADPAASHYCHYCAPAQVDREIPLDEYTEEGHQFYLSLMRGALQVRQGDTVYVLRDIPVDERRPDVSDSAPSDSAPGRAKRDRKKLKVPAAKGKAKDDTQQKEGPRKHTYQTIGSVPVSELDIFRVERLWKHKDTQERYVYGHHYLRPHETFHEPTRKFFHNEVMRVPLYEAVPIELVMSQCWVMDLNTYCKGRPMGASEAHVYICELRVDRSARLFTRVSRPKYPICTRRYAFDHFPQRLRITRTYAPHEVLPEYLKGRAAKNAAPADKNKSSQDNKKKQLQPAIPPISSKVTGAARREQQKERVNGIARRLLARGGPRGALDASYLLAPPERRRARARPPPS